MDSFGRDLIGILNAFIVSALLWSLQFSFSFIAITYLIIFVFIRFAITLDPPACIIPANRGVCLLTGGTQGIGAALAEVLLSDGWKQVVIVARPTAALQSTVQTLTRKYPGAEISAIPADLSKADGAELVYREFRLKHAGKSIDLLINNAGFGQIGDLTAQDPSVSSGQILCNVHSLIQLCRLFLPEMILHRKGAIINIASTAAFQPGPGMSVYFASKSCIYNFSTALAYECRGTGVSVLTSCPGPVATEFAVRAGNDKSFLFRFFPVQSSKSVAEQTYKALKQGERVVITGLNALTAYFSWYCPEAIVVMIAKMTNSH